MGQIGRKMGEIWPKSWRFWRIFEAQMAKSPKTNLGTLGGADVVVVAVPQCPQDFGQVSFIT